MHKKFPNKIKKEGSVLNIDSFDQRRFEQIYKMSNGLQKIDKNKKIPFLKNLLGDIWASLYKSNPEFKENDLINHQMLPNKQLIERMMNEESYLNYRESTQLDDMLSAIGTVHFGNQTNLWLKEQQKNDENLQKKLEEIEKIMEKIQQQQKRIPSNQDDRDLNENPNNNNQQEQSPIEQSFNQAMSELAQQLNVLLNNNSQSFSQSMETAVNSTKSAKRGLESLFGGVQAGSQKSELTYMPLKDKIELAEIISNDQKIKRIAEWAGKFTKIAQTKQKMKYKDMNEQSGIELGDDLERILPSEYALYANPTTKKEFLRKFTEKETLQYEQKGKESLGRGSIILCLDQSGSMENLETESKGFALALISIAKKQKRNFAYIPFDFRVGKVRQFAKGKIKPSEIVQLAREFLGGGTNFKRPLERAMEIISKDKFKDGDLIFITDGNAGLTDYFLKQFNQKRKEKKFNVLSLVIGKDSSEERVKAFSDHVVKIENFNEKGSFKAFEI